MLIAAATYAKFVSPEESAIAANELLRTHVAARLELGKSAPKGFGEARSISEIVPLEGRSGGTLAYIAILEPTGFIAISADTRIEPIVAFSYLCDFPFADSPDNIPLHMVLSDMESRIASFDQTSPALLESNRHRWNDLTSGTSALCYAPSSVHGPFLDTHWDQSSPFNDLCPIDPETGDRCVVGCTATSMAQIVNYWEYPSSVHFTAMESYWSDSTDPPIWIDATTASIDSIDYNGAGAHPDAAMKAAISWACGVSIWAIYSSTGTIAWFHDSSYVDKWGYISAHKVDPPDMPDFYDSLRADMFDAKPAQLGIFYYDPPDTSGHSIVCDGWMDSGEYHLNYGWGGVYDTWYHLPDDLPAPLTILRWAIIDIEPPRRADAGDDRADALSIEIGDEASSRNDEVYPVGDADWYSFSVSDESTYIFYTVGSVDTYGELFVGSDSVARLYDDDTQDGRNFRIVFLPDSSGNCYLRVTGETVGLYALKYSKTSAPSLNFTSPNGGEIFDEGTSQIVYWDRGGMPSISRVDLAYSIDGSDGPWTAFADSVPNSGFYIWHVPDVDTTRDNCFLRVRDASSGRFFDITDSAFAIRDAATVGERGELPAKVALSARPNPFNSCVTLEYSLPPSGGLLKIFDIAGKRLFWKSLSADSKVVRWEAPIGTPSGIYLAVIEAGNERVCKKILLAK